MIVKDKQLVVLVLFVVVPHGVSYGNGKLDGARITDHVMQTFDFGGGSVTESVTDDEMFLWPAFGVIETTQKEGVSIHLVAKSSKFAVTGTQNRPANARHFVFVATGDRAWLQATKDCALGDFQRLIA